MLSLTQPRKRLPKHHPTLMQHRMINSQRVSPSKPTSQQAGSQSAPGEQEAASIMESAEAEPSHKDKKDKKDKKHKDNAENADKKNKKKKDKKEKKHKHTSEDRIDSEEERQILKSLEEVRSDRNRLPFCFDPFESASAPSLSQALDDAQRESDNQVCACVCVCVCVFFFLRSMWN